jgi:dolichyl-phosphate-mannose-protein mannosyltransferase
MLDHSLCIEHAGRDHLPILPLRTAFMDRPLLSPRQAAAPPWFWLGLAALWILALGLRFWGLERFNTLVFDEVYFAQFGHNYLTHTRFFDAHPPLGKYLIAVGIWLKGYNPWGYRWMNALTGSCIPLVVVGIGVQLTRRHSFALLAGALATLDGLLLVESRYGLINVYLLFFGLLAHWLTLLSSNHRGWKHGGILTLAGLSFGAAAAVKWTGLGFLLGLYLFWAIGQLLRLRQREVRIELAQPPAELLRLSFLARFLLSLTIGAALAYLLWQHGAILTLAGLSFEAAATVRWVGFGLLLGPYLLWTIGQLLRLKQKELRPESALPLEQLLRLSVFKLFIWIPVAGIALYSLLWIPHLRQNPEFGFIEVHRQMFGYHRGVKNGPSIHPYCSTLLDWPLMLRPVSYFYQLASSLQEGMPMTGPQLPFNQAKYVYSVYAMGNPPLWWAATVAIAVTLGTALWRTAQALWQGRPRPQNVPRFTAEQQYVPLYLATGYAAQLLPWLSISRCAFLYHYMPAYLFSSLSLAWFLTPWLKTPWQSFSRKQRILLSISLFNVCFSLGVLWSLLLPGSNQSLEPPSPLYLALIFFFSILGGLSVGTFLFGLSANPRLLALVILSLSLLGFMFWLPFYLGLPISPLEWQWRIWLRSWI